MFEHTSNSTQNNNVSYPTLHVRKSPVSGVACHGPRNDAHRLLQAVAKHAEAAPPRRVRFLPVVARGAAKNGGVPPLKHGKIGGLPGFSGKQMVFNGMYVADL